MAREQYEPLTMGEAEDFIGRAAWTSAKSVEEIAPHQYVVQKRGQRRDDFSEEEFWRFEALIKAEGRQEIWTPPEGFYDSGNRRSQKNRYLYVGEYAYWFTMPYGAVPMLNREHVSVQEQNPTRTVPGDRLMARMPTPDGVLEAVVVSQNFFPTLRVPDQVERVARQLWAEDYESGEVAYVLKDDIGNMRNAEGAGPPDSGDQPGDSREGKPRSERKPSETVWVLEKWKSRGPRQLRYHTSRDCPALREFKPKAMKRQEAESEGYTRCRANGPCNSARKAGPRPGRTAR